MEADNKHYKFVNSQTGNAIFYHACSAKLNEDEKRHELDKVKAQVAVKYALFLETIYWEEIPEGN